MKVFAVRLNPDPRASKELPYYSKYPTQKEFQEIWKASPMNGFEEAVNFLSEQGVVRGYLPPRHKPSIKTIEPFLLITVTSSSAKQNVKNRIIGIQAGCKYVGENIRRGEGKGKKKLMFHYTCPESLSLLFDEPLANARELLDSSKWSYGPTYEIKIKRVMEVIDAAIKEGSVKKAVKKLKLFVNGSKGMGAIHLLIIWLIQPMKKMWQTLCEEGSQLNLPVINLQKEKK